jgi:hypothetical protein
MKAPTTFKEPKVVVPPDDGGPITFRWHFPRGTLAPRMSAYELAEFLLPHMPHILPFFSEHPRVYREFETMLLMLAHSPREVVDRLVPWVRSVTRTADTDIVLLDISSVTPQNAGKVYSLGS